jgi:TolB-like protein
VNYELRHNGQPQPLEPQVFDLLSYLAQRQGNVVSRDELFENLWLGKVVSESTLSSCIKAARKAIGDDGKSQTFIATLNRRGYRFVAEVTTEGEEPSVRKDAAILSEATIAASQERGDACLFPVNPAVDPDRPSLAVMPFAHSGGGEQIAWLAETMTEDISIQLARIPGFIVIATNSTASYRDREYSISQVGKELGTQYVIEGSIWGLGQRIRVSVQLLETATNSMLWADRTEIPSDMLDAYQDDVVQKILSCIEPELHRAELKQLGKRRRVDLGAWQLYRQAHAILGLKGWSSESFNESADLLRQAIKQDPELAFAHAYLSLILAMGHLVGLLSDDNWQEEALRAAETAISLDNQDSLVLGYVGCALADMGDHHRGVGMLRRAVELNPCNAQALAALGAALLQLGDAEGIDRLQEGMRMSPRDTRLAAWGALLARGLLNHNRTEEAIDVADKACQCDDKIFLPRIVLAIARYLVDDVKGAKAALTDAARIRPELSKEDIRRFARPEELSGLESAGLI